jgi:hypothetical protein
MPDMRNDPVRRDKRLHTVKRIRPDHLRPFSPATNRPAGDCFVLNTESAKQRTQIDHEPHTGPAHGPVSSSTSSGVALAAGAVGMDALRAWSSGASLITLRGR